MFSFVFFLSFLFLFDFCFFVWFWVFWSDLKWVLFQCLEMIFEWVLKFVFEVYFERFLYEFWMFWDGSFLREFLFCLFFVCVRVWWIVWEDDFVLVIECFEFIWRVIWLLLDEIWTCFFFFVFVWNGFGLIVLTHWTGFESHFRSCVLTPFGIDLTLWSESTGWASFLF